MMRPKKELKMPKRLRKIVHSCATCGLIVVDKLSGETKCIRPGGPVWSDRRKDGSASHYVCDRWRK